jgi:hypothetical protein
MAKIGALSAVIDAITAAKQAGDMKRLGDISAAIGASAVAGGNHCLRHDNEANYRTTLLRPMSIRSIRSIRKTNRLFPRSGR